MDITIENITEEDLILLFQALQNTSVSIDDREKFVRYNELYYKLQNILDVISSQ